ncbi:phosphoglycolate phosphatase-like HAD superfamily hydrolase [Pseudoduganella flava]|uniref:Phosphoglycolate phosphatase-like HAD superfamily hydrolase n=1 Tax=Pseudoduganella flava TaxID=871742 RepID=A0A562PMZ7_9BURK|nr:NUDIX hydrolase N-terminal domain-containing protein [Pseudoduganella flava]TWI45841.1 phosphoglycolate phosphatase-like HAD superfamily hydrolase [Pseudoduganella flava]
MTTPVFRAVLFDLDGTLADTIPLCIAAFRATLEPQLGPLTDEQIVAAFGPDEEGVIRTLAPGYQGDGVATFLQHYETQHALCPAPFPGIAPLLRELRERGVRLGLVTGKGAGSTRLSLRRFGLDLFDVIETGSPHGSRKAEALRHTLAQWDVPAAAAVYIGDAPTDVTIARDVGLAAVAAAWAGTAEVDALQATAPDLLATSVDALHTWLLARLGGDETPWLWIAQRLQALAQAGLAYNPPPFDAERYQEVLALSQRMLGGLTGHPPARYAEAAAPEQGYPTPKVDIRAVLFRGTDEILMAREKHDGGRWSLPGGWADVGYTPFEVAVKEVQEETGLDTEAVRLLALWDKRVHPHPPQSWYVYKAFVLCRITGGSLLADTAETTEVRWVHRSELAGLDISVDRVTLSQLERLFDFASDPDLPTLCD